MPWADFNLLKLPEGTEHENDFTMLSDIFPTGFHGAELAGVGPGDTVAVFGAGPVGLLAAHSAWLRGASQVFVVDKEPDRLSLAERFGATAVNFADVDPTEVITDATDGSGVDCGIEAVGYQAHDATGQEHPVMVLDKLAFEQPTHGGVPEPFRERDRARAEQPRGVRVAFLVGVGVVAAVVGDPVDDRALHDHAADHRERDPQTALGFECAVGEVTVETDCDAEAGEGVEGQPCQMASEVLSTYLDACVAPAGRRIRDQSGSRPANTLALAITTFAWSGTKRVSAGHGEHRILSVV